MKRALFVLRWLLIGAGVLLVALYAGDSLAVRYRMAHAKTGDPLDETTFYYATLLKNGRIQVFYDQPQTEVCVHALFPHLGYRPCWYAHRSSVRQIG
jgi:hypothetical protein